MNPFLLVLFIQTFLLQSLYSQTNSDEKTGIPPSTYTCEIYEKHTDWLPDAFINNATCACIKIPDEYRANVIRQVLIERLDSVNLELKTKAVSMKKQCMDKTISKHKYNKFIKREITPVIYRDHIIAYEKAGCKADPAPFFGWKQITTRKVKSCKLIWFSIRYFGGSCSGKWGKW
jgi:hypothetical protein